METQPSVIVAAPRTKPLYRATRIVWYILAVLEVFLAFRFLLKLFAANPAAGFTSFVYAITYPFALPFLAVFRSTRVEGSVFEWTTLLAMAVYWLLAWGIVKLVAMGRPVSTIEASQNLAETDRT